MPWSNDEELRRAIELVNGNSNQSITPLDPMPVQPLVPNDQAQSLWDKFDLSGANLPDIGKSLYNGAVADNAKTISGIVQSVGDAINAVPLPSPSRNENEGIGQAISDFGKSIETSSIGSPYELESDNVLNDTARGIGQFAGAAAILAATKNPWLAAGSTGLQTYGMDYSDNAQKGVSPLKNAAASGVDAAISTGIDRFGFGKLADTFIKGASPLKAAGKGLVTEGITEGLQEYPNEYTQGWAQGETPTFGDVSQNALYSGLIGGLSGAGVSGAAAAINNRLRNRGNAAENMPAKVEIPENQAQRSPVQDVSPNMWDAGEARDFLARQNAVNPLSTPEEKADYNLVTQTLNGADDGQIIDFARNRGYTPAYPNRTIELMDKLVQAGYSPEEAAGFAGNLMAESGGNTMDIDSSAVNPQSGATGIAQWLGPRLDQLKDWALATGRDWQSPSTQMDFLIYELQNGEAGSLENIRSIEDKTPEGYSAAVDQFYERSEGTTRDQRATNARTAYDAYTAWKKNGGAPEQQGGAPEQQEDSATKIETPKAQGIQESEDVHPEEQETQTEEKQEEVQKTTEEQVEENPQEDTGVVPEETVEPQETHSVKQESIRKTEDIPTETLMKNPTLVDTVQKAMGGDPQAQQALEKAKVAPNVVERVQKAIADRSAQNQPAQPRPYQQNAQSVPQLQKESPAQQTKQEPSIPQQARPVQQEKKTNETKPYAPEEAPADAGPFYAAQEPMQHNVEAHAPVKGISRMPEGSEGRIRAMAKKAADSPAVVSTIQKADAGDANAQAAVNRNFSPELQQAIREEIQNKETTNGKENPVAEGKDSGKEVEESSSTARKGQEKTPEKVSPDDHILIANVTPEGMKIRSAKDVAQAPYIEKIIKIYDKAGKDADAVVSDYKSGNIKTKQAAVAGIKKIARKAAEDVASAQRDLYNKHKIVWVDEKDTPKRVLEANQALADKLKADIAEIQNTTSSEELKDRFANGTGMFNEKALKNAPQPVKDIINKMPKAEETKTSKKTQSDSEGTAKGENKKTEPTKNKNVSDKKAYREINREIRNGMKDARYAYSAVLKNGVVTIKDIATTKGARKWDNADSDDITLYQRVSYSIPVTDLTDAVRKDGTLQKGFAGEIFHAYTDEVDKMYDEAKQIEDAPSIDRMKKWWSGQKDSLLKYVDDRKNFNSQNLDSGLAYRMNAQWVTVKNVYAKYLKDHPEISSTFSNNALKELGMEPANTSESATIKETDKGGTDNGRRPEGLSGPVEVQPAGSGERVREAGGESGRSSGEANRGSKSGESSVSGKSEEGTGRGVQRPGQSGNGNEAGQTGRVGNDERGPEVPVKESITPKIDKIEEKVESRPTVDISGNDYTPKALPKRSNGDRAKDNIAAIKLLKKIQSEARKATPEEQAELAKYSGWGGLSVELQKHAKELREATTESEYRAIEGNVGSAFFTPPYVVSSMWRIADRLGFKGGKVLDPSTGTGIFFGLMPKQMRAASALIGTEKDPITAQIAQQLYQSASIRNQPFENIMAKDGYFDLAITNVPFGSTRPADPKYNKFGYKLHNYFFAKAFDKVRPGGLVMFITSRNTMDGKGDAEALRREIDKHGEFVGAIRLPSGVFEETNTDVATDIVIIRKLDTGEKPKANAWDEIGSLSYENVNQYFIDHPEMIIGHYQEIFDRRYRKWVHTWTIKKDGEPDIDVEKELGAKTKLLPENIYTKKKPAPANTIKKVKELVASSSDKVGDLVEKDGTLGYVTIDGSGEKNVTPFAKSAQKVMRGYQDVSSALDDVLEEQVNPNTTEETLSKKRKKLNEAYDSFVKQFGNLHDKNNMRNIGKVSSSNGRVLALEISETDANGKVSYRKADIFTKRTVGTDRKINVSTPSDALAASLQEEGTVDLKYMGQLLGKSEKEVINELGDAIIKDPASEIYVTRDEYLSGNVRQKLEMAEDAAKKNPEYQKNVDALKKVVPKDLTESDIDVEMGASWMPVPYVKQFIVDTIGAYSDDVNVIFDPVTSKWSVTISGWSKSYSDSNKTYGTDNVSFKTAVESALNIKTIKINAKKRGGMDPTEAEIKAAADETEVANSKVETLKKDFVKWLFSDADRKKNILDSYNQTYNSEVVREYDGSFLQLPGKSTTTPELNPHQKNAIWRIVKERAVLLAHVVGAGKTWTMQAAGMELRRMGLARKPLYIMPKNTVFQFRNEFLQLYPNAKILVLTSDDLPDVQSLEPKIDKKTGKEIPLTEAQKERIRKNSAIRNAMLQRIKTEDWDAIVMSHETFKRLPMSNKAYEDFYTEQLNDYRRALEAEKESGKKTDFRKIQSSIDSLEAKLKKLSNVDEKYNLGEDTFETLGIDQLFVDEADLFKNMSFPTSFSNVHGISNKGSQRSEDLFIKCRYLEQNPSTHGVVFATGTPISNSPAEMYTMLRYLANEKMESMGIRTFDDFARAFFDIREGIEVNPVGTGYRVATHVDGLKNAPEAKRLFRLIADVKTADDIPEVKKARPRAQRIAVKVNPSKWLDNYFNNVILPRVAALKGRPEKGADNILAIQGDCRKATLDPRLVDPDAPMEEANNKIGACVEKVYEEYVNSTPTKGTQLIFCDLSVPKDKPSEDADASEDAETAENISVYQRVKDQLVRMGIPADEVRFIHEAKNDKQKEDMFLDVREGRIRVLIGSTPKMGAGSNMQNKLVALHHLDVPWRPRDLEQREGRILRRGNENKEVRIYNYGSPGSFDAVMWDKVRQKAALIRQMTDGDLSTRHVDCSDEVQASFAEMQAICAKNPDMIALLNAEKKVNTLLNLRRSFESDQRAAQKNVEEIPIKIEGYKTRLDNAKKDMKERTEKGNFSITIEGKKYTNREEANAAFQKVTQKAVTQFVKDSADGLRPLPYPAGEVAGFKILVSARGADVTVNIQGYNTYTAQTPTAVGAYNAAYSSPEKLADGLTNIIKGEETRLEEAKDIAASKFEHQSELEMAQEELAIVNKRIENAAKGNNPSEAANGNPPEGTEKKFSVTNKRLRADTPVKVVDITDSPRFNLGDKEARDNLRDALRGSTFKIADTEATAKLTTRKDFDKKSIFDGMKHIIWSTPKSRNNVIRLKALGDIEALKKIFSNAVYVERNANPTRNPKHGGAYFVDLYIPVKNGDKIYTLRIVAEDTNLAPDEYEISNVDLYDMYKIREISRTPANADGTRNEWFRETSPDTITVAEMLGSVKDRQGKPFVRGDGSLNYEPSVLEDMIRESFPTAQNVTQTENGIEFDLPNGIHMTVNQTGIEMNETEKASAAKAHGVEIDGDMVAAGYFQPKKTTATREGLIAMAPDSGIETLDHEAFHVSYWCALNDNQRNVLETYAKDKLHATDDTVEEALADDYSAWKERRRQGRGSIMGKLYQKMADFAAKMLSFVSETAKKDRIYAKLESGEVFRNASELNETAKDITKKYSLHEAGDKFVNRFNSLLKKQVGDNVYVQSKGETERDRLKKSNAVLLQTFASPSRSKNPHVVYLHRLARKAQDTQNHFRREWTEELADALRGLKTDEDLQTCSDLLWAGDLEGKNYTDADLDAMEVNESVKAGYQKIRSTIKKIHDTLDAVKTRRAIRTLSVKPEEVGDIKKIPWVKVLSEKEEGGKVNVVFDGPDIKFHDTTNMSADKLEKLREDPNAHIVSEEGRHVKYYTRPAGVADRAGYIPHIFHDVFITEKKLDIEASEKVRKENMTKDALEKLKKEDGVTIVDTAPDKNKRNRVNVQYTREVYNYRVVGSAETIRDAVAKADGLPKGDDVEYYVTPKELTNGGASNGVLMSDEDYNRMILRETAKFGRPLPEVKEMMRGVVRTGSKHKFNGSFLHRKGSEGYEEDIVWVLKNHIENSARYVALEPFKLNALTHFEKAFGGFQNKHDYFSVAGWSQAYIQSMLGTPMQLERAVNDILEFIPGYKEFNERNHGRGSRAIATDITSVMSVAKLGFVNISSAAMNVTQLINLNGIVGPRAVLAGMKHALHPSKEDLAVIRASHIEDDAGLSSVDGLNQLRIGSGVLGGKSFMGMYSKYQNPVLRAGDYMMQIAGKSMFLFSASEKFVRRTAILAAYYANRDPSIPMRELEGVGLVDRRAMSKARDINDFVNFDYSKVDEPAIFRETRGTILGDMSLQFKKYAVKQLGVMAHFTFGSDATTAQKLNYWIPTLALCGLFTPVPMQDWIFELFGWLFDDDDMKSTVKKEIMNWAGDDKAKQAVAKAAMYGVLGTAGLDVSNRIGLSDVLPEYNGPASLLGPTGSTVSGLFRAAQSGDVLYGLKMTAPAMANLYQAVTGTATDSKGRHAYDFDDYQRLLKAFGFRTVDESISTDARRIVSNERKNRSAELAKAKEAYKENPTAENRKVLHDMGMTSSRIRALTKEKETDSSGRTTKNMSKREKEELGGVLNFMS